jgi:hypothetical protein
VIETSFSGAIEWAYPGVYPFDGSRGAVMLSDIYAWLTKVTRRRSYYPRFSLRIRSANMLKSKCVFKNHVNLN